VLCEILFGGMLVPCSSNESNFDDFYGIIGRVFGVASDEVTEAFG
jgi:hypothetical protein